MYNFNRDVIPWYILQNVIDVCDRLHFTFALIKRLLFFIYKFYIIFFTDNAMDKTMSLCPIF